MKTLVAITLLFGGQLSIAAQPATRVPRRPARRSRRILRQSRPSPVRPASPARQRGPVMRIRGTRHTMMIIRPDPNHKYTVLWVRPNPNVEYQILRVNPRTQKRMKR